MKKITLTLLALLSGSAFAQGSGIKPGLWETKQLKQIMDGRDMLAQMAAAQAEMQKFMAKMPPAQREKMEAMMKQQGRSMPGPDGSTRICISAAMAANDKPMVDPEGRCKPGSVNRSGDKISFEFDCSEGERSMVGKGENIIGDDTVTTRVDMLTKDPKGQHKIQSEYQMRYLGADCKGIKPADELFKEARNSGNSK